MAAKKGRGRPKKTDAEKAAATSPTRKAPKRKSSAKILPDAPKRTLRQRAEEKIVEVIDEKTVGGVLKFRVIWGDENRPKSWESEDKVPAELVEKFREEPESDEEYEVEKLLDVKKGSGKKTKYLVRWSGFNSDHDSWEPAENLPKGKIAAFNKKQEQDESSDEEEKSDDEDREYTVEKIIMRRGVGKRRLYRIRWAGFSDHHNSWEPEENLSGAKKMLREFNKLADEREAKRMEKEYEVEKIVDEKTRYGKPLYCVKWNGYKNNHNTWQDAESLADCQDVLEKWEKKKEQRAEKQHERNAKRDKKKAEERKKREEAKLSKAAENAAKKATTA